MDIRTVLSPAFIERAKEYSTRFTGGLKAAQRLPLLLKRSRAAEPARVTAVRMLEAHLDTATQTETSERSELNFQDPTFSQFMRYLQEIAAHSKHVLTPVRELIDTCLAVNPRHLKMQTLRGMLA